MLTRPISPKSGTTVFFSVNLVRAMGATTPPTAAYRTVYNLTTGAVITPETPITLDGTLTLTFKTTDTENTIVDPDLESEKRRVAIRVTFGVGDAFTDDADYTLKRVAPIPA